MQRVLSGVRVLDFGRFIAGPCCAALLGDLGAEVIRVEKREGGEDRWLGPIGENGEGPMFLQNNRNKMSMTLDPSVPQGAEIVERLVLSADIVVVNLTETVQTQLGLNYERLRAIRPDIILTSMSAFGTGGPYSERLAFDAVGQLMSGAVSRTGFPDQPVRTPVQYIDVGTALAAAVGTLAALMHRRATGEGQKVEASLISTALMMTSTMLIEQAVTTANRSATGNRGQLSAPNDIFSVKDGWILIQGVGQPIFKRWAKLMGEDHWLQDPRFKTDKTRGENWQDINARTTAWCSQYTKAEALRLLEEARVPAYPVNTLQEALDDPHVNAMGYLKPTSYPGLPRPAPIVETPFRLSATPPSFRLRPPTLGEHTEQILVGLGYGAAQIEEFRSHYVI